MKELEEKLKLIGWSIAGSHLNRYIYNHNGTRTAWRVCGDRIEANDYSGDIFGKGKSGSNGDVCFYFDNFKIETLENEKGKTNCVSLVANENVFINFYNHDRNPKEEK